MQGQAIVETNGAGGHNGLDTGGVGNVGHGGASSRASIVHALAEQSQAARSLIENMKALVGDDDELIETAVEGETNLHEALETALNRLAELNAIQESISTLMETLRARNERLASQREAIRTAMAIAMEMGAVKKLELPLGTLSLRTVAPTVEITDEAAIPARFWKPQDPKLDKREVAKALKDGLSVPGAQMSPPTTTISVRTA